MNDPDLAARLVAQVRRQSGGPAFPRQPSRIEFSSGQVQYDEGAEGMTLRQYYAGCALIGLAARMDADARRRYLDNRADGHDTTIAFRLADAMLAADTEPA